MANYWNLRNHEWMLLNNGKQGDGKSYRIIVGLNKNLPNGLDIRFKGMLRLQENPKTPEPKNVVPAEPVKVQPVKIDPPKPEIAISKPVVVDTPKPVGVPPVIDVQPKIVADVVIDATVEPDTKKEEPEEKTNLSLPETKQDALQLLEENYKKDLAEIEASDRNNYSKSQQRRHVRNKYEKDRKLILGE